MSSNKQEVKNSIQTAQLGGDLIARAAAIKEGDKSVHVIGYILAEISGVSFRRNPQGDEPSLAFKGMFEAISADPDVAPVVAPLCFLPSGFSKVLAAQILGDKMGDAPTRAPDAKAKPIDIDGSGVVKLTLEIGIRKKAGAGGRGYEFAVTMMGDKPQTRDALAEQRAALPSQLAKATVPALPAPKGGAKKKGR